MERTEYEVERDGEGKTAKVVVEQINDPAAPGAEYWISESQKSLSKGNTERAEKELARADQMIIAEGIPRAEEDSLTDERFGELIDARHGEGWATPEDIISQYKQDDLGRALLKSWGEGELFLENIKFAQSVGQTILHDDDREFLETVGLDDGSDYNLGSHPRVVQLAAKIGRLLGIAQADTGSEQAYSDPVNQTALPSLRRQLETLTSEQYDAQLHGDGERAAALDQQITKVAEAIAQKEG